MLLVILLPGTLIHELSHFIIASILRVPTGELTIFPVVEKNGEVKAGKLFLGATDPFRFSLIGLAPMIIGLVIIYFVGKLFFSDLSQSTINNQQLSIFLGFYLLFITSITMFSSKKDIAGLKFTIPIILIILISLYAAGIRVFFDKPLTSKIEILLSGLNYYLLLTAVTNSLIFLILSTNLSFWQKILKRRVN